MNSNEHPPVDTSELPLDSDVEVDDVGLGAPRPVHLRPSYLALVAAGGVLGTATREALTLAVPTVAGVPIGTFAINVFGAFLLGFLLEALVRRGPDHGDRRTLRLLLGTGFLGGFTTYSALATDTALLMHSADNGAAIVYSVATIVVGAAGTWAGIVVATVHHRARHPEAVAK